jgi:hypothetical protein
MAPPIRKLISALEAAQILDVCLQKIERGQATIEDCVAEYPYYYELGELLRVAAAVHNMPHPVMAPKAKAALKQQTLAKLKIVAKPRHRRLPAVARLAAILALVLFIFSGSGWGLIQASASALPGDSLYSVKRSFEQVEIALSRSEAQPDLWTHFAQVRLTEIEQLTTRGDSITDSVVTDTLVTLNTALKIQPDADQRSALLTQADVTFKSARALLNDDPSGSLTALAVVSPTNPVNVILNGEHPTGTAVITRTVSTTSTVTQTATASVTVSLSPSPTLTNTDIPSLTPSDTDIPSLVPTDTDVPSATDISTVAPTIQPTHKPHPQNTPNGNGTPNSGNGNSGNGNGNGNSGNGNGKGNSKP